VVNIQTDLNTALSDLESTHLSWQESAALLASAQRRLAAGEADWLEWLNALIARTEAVQDRFKAILDWHSAKLQLLATAGVIDSGLLPSKAP
jgi:outer membrane protein